MSDVKVNISYTSRQFPGGTAAPDHVSVTLTGSNPANTYSQNVPPATASVTFSNVTPDSYTVAIREVDAGGNGLASVSDSVTVSPPPPVTYSVPVGSSCQVI